MNRACARPPRSVCSCSRRSPAATTRRAPVREDPTMMQNGGGAGPLANLEASPFQNEVWLDEQGQQVGFLYYPNENVRVSAQCRYRLGTVHVRCDALHAERHARRDRASRPRRSHQRGREGLPAHESTDRHRAQQSRQRGRLLSLSPTARSSRTARSSSTSCASSSSGERRERDDEARALADRARHVDRAVHRLDEVLHDREPEPCAAVLARATRIDPVEALEEPRQVRGVDAWAVVAHRHRHGACRRGRR